MDLRRLTILTIETLHPNLLELGTGSEQRWQ